MWTICHLTVLLDQLPQLAFSLLVNGFLVVVFRGAIGLEVVGDHEALHGLVLTVVADLKLFWLKVIV